MHSHSSMERDSTTCIMTKIQQQKNIYSTENVCCTDNGTQGGDFPEFTLQVS